MSRRNREFKSFRIVIIMIVLAQITFGAIRYNEKCTINNECWAVGDSGVIMKIKDDSVISQQVLLNGDYNFTSISLATSSIGWITGYKKDEPDKWKGIILKTIDSCKTWISLRAYTPAFAKPTPFLKVYSINKYIVWVKCGYGYNLRTMDGGISWCVSSKPINP
jgi:photosystem II stability/assembly factor-like uncharacterized protein